MCLVLWWEWAKAQRVHEAVEAHRIASGESRMPREWIEVLAGSEEEAAAWRRDEFQRSVSAPGAR